MACLRPAWSASLFALVAACFVAACSPREAAVPTPREDRSGAGAASAATPATAPAGAEAGVGADAGAGASTGASADSTGAAEVGAAAPGSSVSTAGAATPPLKGPITAAEAAELNLAASTSRKLGAPAAASSPAASNSAAAASIAASNSAAGAQDGGASEDAPCAKDADCAFTRFEAGNCCPILCEPRVVTKRRAAELEATFANCNGGRQCPHPLCQPPRAALTPVCEARRCAARLSGPANSPRD